MTITIYGAGAIGGITGARLAQAGHDILLVDKAQDHVDAMNARGLTIDSREGAVTIPVRAITPGALGSGLELVLLAVKSQDTPAALEILTSRLAPDGAIVSLQNGLNEELIASAVGAGRTVGCLVNWAADWQAPGRILHGGEGALVLGELDGRRSERVQGLAKLLDVVSPTRVSDNILGYTWAKHVYGSLLVATALVDAHVYEVVERSPAVQQMLVALTLGR
jgi:2-dehydropantoate 2-reductase